MNGFWHPILGAMSAIFGGFGGAWFIRWRDQGVDDRADPILMMASTTPRRCSLLAGPRGPWRFGRTKPGPHSVLDCANHCHENTVPAARAVGWVFLRDRCRQGGCRRRHLE